MITSISEFQRRSEEDPSQSATRKDCTKAVCGFANIILADQPESKKLLYVGVAGDPVGGEYTPLFKPSFDTTTLDFDPKWKPDLVGDITKSEDFCERGKYGVLVCVQVIEHVRNMWDLPLSLQRAVCKGGYVIIDCPWMYPYHAEPPSFGDFWRISPDGMKALFGNHFDLIQVVATKNNTSCLLRKQ